MKSILTVGSVIALAFVVVPSLAAAHEPSVSIDDLPPPSGDPEELKQYLAKECTKAVQLVQPGRRCDVQ